MLGFLDCLSEGKGTISDEDGVVTYPEFVSHIEEKAKMLPAQKMRVYFTLERTIDSVEWFFAFMKAKALLFIGNPTCAFGKLTQLFDYIQPHAAVLPHFQAIYYAQTTPLGKNRVLIPFAGRPLLLDPNEAESDIAIMTSGTTGEPKAILHRFSSLLLNARLHADAIGLKATDRVGAALPLHFSYGLVANLFASLLHGCSLSFSPVIGEIEVLSATPLFMKRTGAAPLRVLTIGGDVTPPALAEKILTEHPRLELFTTYGLTEAGPRVATCKITRDDCRRLSLPLGDPLPGVSLIQDAAQELFVKTPTAMVGYFRNVEETEKTLLPDGIRTGDMFKLEEGNLFFLGRKKRMISKGGEKIYPSEIENALQRIPEILDSYVAQNGEDRSIAYIQTEKGLDQKEVVRHLRSYLPRAHIPDDFSFVSELPAEARKK